ncbi:MAG: NAD(P)-binding domain-containing protein [Rhizobiales bacterium]|nr:NAD(P)-binding domain-containing protein [Hyphomicrobiales bacterium]
MVISSGNAVTGRAIVLRATCHAHTSITTPNGVRKRNEGYMKIVIVGSGNVGQALGSAWRNCGHDIDFAVRDPTGEKAKRLTGNGYHVAAVADAAQQADVILLAVPWTELSTVIESLGTLAGKIVIDATNPLTPDLEMALGFDDSAGETVGLLAQDARVVKAFNTTGADNMTKAKDFSFKPLMPIAGDDMQAKAVVAKLAEDIGFEAIDTGPLKMSRCLEPMALIWIKLALAQKLGTQHAFALVRR